MATDKVEMGGTGDYRRGREKPLRVRKRVWLMLTCQNRLIGKFMFFIVLSFMVFYVLYISLLPPFTRVWFSQMTFAEIEGEYISQTNER